MFIYRRPLSGVLAGLLTAGLVLSINLIAIAYAGPFAG